jgi:hypothetical protein
MSTQEEWCDYGDMPKVMCEHCITGKKTAGTNNDGLGVGSGFRGPTMIDDKPEDAAVPAQIQQRCPLCGEQIEIGDWIVRGTLGWRHEVCP